MRVTHNMLANSVSQNIQRNLRALERRSNQLSMGKMFDRPSQDPVGTYRSMRITSTGLARNEQFSRNIGEGKTWLNSTESALADSIDAVQRLRELAVYASNDTFSTEDRKAVAPEVEQLLDHLISLGNTDVAGLYIFGGHKTQDPPYRVAGANGELLNDWYNQESGLTADNIELDNLLTGDYAVSTEAEKDPGVLDEAARAYLMDEYIQGARDGFFGGYNAASLTVGDVNEDNAVRFTAREEGAYGNNIEVVYETNDNGDIAIDVGRENGAYRITVTMDENEDFTAKQVADAVNGHEEASALVQASVNLEGNGGGSGDVDPDIFEDPDDPDETIPISLSGGAGGIGEVYSSDEGGNLEDDSPWNGTVALEVQEAKKFGQFSSDIQDKIINHPNIDEDSIEDVDEQDLIVRLSAGYQLYDLDGKNYSGTYGNQSGEDIYINMTKLKEDDQSITFKAREDDWVTMKVPPNANITYEREEVKVGDKAVFQLKPELNENDPDFDRFTLHQDYGRPDEQGRPTMGDALNWHFNADEDFFDEKTRTLKFHDIDQATGQFITSSISPTFEEEFQTADAARYYDPQDLEKHGVPDDEFDEHPAAIFSFVAPGDPYYMGDDGERLIEISPDQKVPANITGIEAFGETELFQTVRDMHQALVHDEQFTLSNEVIDQLDNHLDGLLRSRSDIGARMERMEVTEERLHSERIYLREHLSKVEDVDMADAITEFMMQENAYQAALATGARMVYPSLIDFLR